MTANRNLLRMKFSRVVEAYARRTGCSLDDALRTFYCSETYSLMRDGISDMHCMSVPYLVDELVAEGAAGGERTAGCGRKHKIVVPGGHSPSANSNYEMHSLEYPPRGIQMKISRKFLICCFSGLVALANMFLRADTWTDTQSGIKWTYTLSGGHAHLGGGAYSSPAVPTNTAGVLTIPSSIRGYSVVGMKNYAFNNCRKLTAVVIPSGVTNISDYAFHGCSVLASVTIPSSVKIIGYGAFGACTNLVEVSIPEGVERLGYSAFNECLGLKEVSLPSSLTNVQYGAFSNCGSLTAIYVSDANPCFKMEKGCLLSKDGTELVRGPAIRSVEIPAGVKILYGQAFDGCYGLETVTLPEGLEVIGYSAFEECRNLLNVSIPSSVYMIEPMAFRGCKSLTYVGLPPCLGYVADALFSDCSSLEEVSIPTGVTEIWNMAFANCEKLDLAKMKIPESVGRIAVDAFAGCCPKELDTHVMLVDRCLVRVDGNYGSTGLESPNIPDGTRLIADETFSFSFFTEVDIPSSVENIGANAFCGSFDLKKVVFHEGLRMIGDGAFSYCPSLEDVNFPDGLKQIGMGAFSDCPLTSLCLPSGIEAIGSSAFYGCRFLTAVEIPDGCTSIGGYAFCDCSELQSVSLPKTLASIGADVFKVCSNITQVIAPASFKFSSVFPSTYSTLSNITLVAGTSNVVDGAFSGCASLTTIIVPEGVENIGVEAFRSCVNLTAIELPASVTNIGARAFMGCKSLTSVRIPNGLASIDLSAFSGCVQVRSLETPSSVVVSSIFSSSISQVTNIVISAGSTYVVTNAFKGASSLKVVDIPDSVRYIGDGAFQRCTSLRDVSFGEGLTSIGYSAFYGCENIRNLELPSTLQGIGSYAFWGCLNLSEVMVPDQVTTIGGNAFGNCPLLLELEYPSSLVVDGMTYSGNRFVRTAVFPEGVDWIDLNGCTNLEEVVLPSTIKYLQADTFSYSPKLKSVVCYFNPAECSSDGWNWWWIPLFAHTEELYYSSAYAKEWEKLLKGCGFGGRYGAFDGDWEDEGSLIPDSGNLQPSVVTNFVYVTVTNVIHTSSTVTNVVAYVPEPGTSPSAVYTVKAGAAAEQKIAGAVGWDVLGLPEGMSWDVGTGTLGGTPVKSGAYDIILVSGSGADTRMMRTVVAVAGFDPIVGYVGTDFAWKGAPMDMLADYKNLPAGLKWTAASATLAGVPTKAGDFSRETVHGDPVSFVVEDLPASAVGTWNGMVSLEGTNYPLVVTATKAGKLTAKIAVGAKTLSLTAASWSGSSRSEDGHLLFRAAFQTKTDALDVVLDADAPWNARQLAATVTLGALSGATGAAQRNAFGKVGTAWECPAAHELALSLAGSYTFDAEPAEQGGWRLVVPPSGKVGALKVVIKDTGTVSISGKLDGASYTSSTTLQSDGTFVFFVKGIQVSGRL